MNDQDEWRKKSRLTGERFLALLKRQRQRIADGIKLWCVDSNEMGNKFNDCTWGLCCCDMEVWPDEEDWLFKPSDTYRGRKLVKEARPKYRADDQFCPFDRKDNDQVGILGSGGCFYRCMMFSPKRLRPGREEALKLYDEQIEEVSEALDDGIIKCSLHGDPIPCGTCAAQQRGG